MKVNFLSINDQINIRILESAPNIDNYIVKEGVLCVKNIFDRIKSLFFGAFYAKEIQHCVHSIFEHTLEKTSDPLSKTTAIIFCRHFAFNIAARLSKNHFDRALLSKDMQNILSPELAALRKEKESSAFVPNEEATLQRRIAKSKLAFKLGIYPQKNKLGATGTYILNSVNGKPLGCFKTIVPELFTREYFLYLLGKILGYTRQTDLIRNRGTLSGIYSDIAAARIDTLINTHLVPGTQRLILEDENVKIDGSFSSWHRHCTEASKIIPNANPTYAELLQFQKLAILDFLIGNLDRHNNNWLIKPKDNHMQAIVAIDNSNSFLERNPTRIGTIERHVKTHQYEWKNHPYAWKFLLPDARAIMRTLTEENINAFISDLRRTLQDNKLDKIDNFLNEDMIFHLKERAAILRALAENPYTKPFSIAWYSTQQDIDAFCV